MEEAEKLVVLQESALREVHGIATANDVQLITLPSRLFEPINTIIVLLRSPLLAVGAVSYLFGKPENRRVVYLAPGASKTLKVKLAKGSQRLADRKGRLKVRAVASTGPSGKIAQTSRRLTLALGTAAKRK